jgi:pilus assembly protein TadC
MNAVAPVAAGLAGLAVACGGAGVRAIRHGGARSRLPHPEPVAHPHRCGIHGPVLAWSWRTKAASALVAVLLLAVLPWPLPLVIPSTIAVVVLARRFHQARVRKRHEAAIDHEVPQLLDLLAAGSSAGLAAPLALRRAADGLRGPLADEIRSLTRSVDLGARWRDELVALVERLDISDLRRAVAVLTRTETLGSSLEEATAELAASVRQARRAAVMERARAAPVKMLFPLVFLVLPAFLLLTVVPVLLTTVQSIR